MAGRPILRRTCAQLVLIRVILENEIPPAMRVDIYSFGRIILLSATDEKKKEFIQICGKIELRNQIYTRGDLYELQTFYHGRALLSTRILCQREKLSGNSKTFGKECQQHFPGDHAE